ncbi:PWWP domain [Dermatophagoides pteronyssinus]|uniref:Uncharacterized protein LOC113794582 n=2 Tax=Dermatophagoides pteronyssinus TaxID=6956 RepID=A0A6P6Y4W0_DERPT|nr:uncharacterized protein LOC113794582 [Dermatophagoides pteronyssinus]KAH9421357.1 PWWP domain [Dermatophagoides pteronyssinus]
MLIDDVDTAKLRRTLDPEITHGIWSAIIQLSLKQHDNGSDGIGCDYDQVLVEQKCLVEYLVEHFSQLENSENVSKSIEKAIDEGLIRKQRNKSAEDGQLMVMNGNVNDSEDHNVENNEIECLIGLPHETVKFPSHDWYCFECHRINCKSKTNDDESNETCSSSLILIKCQHCWRVYHRKCVQQAVEFIDQIIPENDRINSSNSSSETFTCPVCLLIQKYSSFSVGSRHFDQKEFNQILSYTYTRFKAKASHQISHSLLNMKQLLYNTTSMSSLISSKIISSLPSSSTSSSVSSQEMNGESSSETNKYKKSIISPKDLLNQLAMNYLSYKPVELVDIEKYLQDCQYKTIGEFLGDCLTVRHMLEVVVCSQSEQSPTVQRRIRDALSRMLEATRYELKEMIGCVDCYRNSNRQNNKLWFCWPCDPPHMLVFAKQKGYPYWPAKVIYPRNSDEIAGCNQLDVRFFGSNHERSLIDKANIKDINSSLSELNILKPMPSLDKALQELRAYRELLESTDELKNETHSSLLKISGKKDEIHCAKNNSDNKCNLKNGDESIRRTKRKVKSKFFRQAINENDDEGCSEDLMTEESNSVIEENNIDEDGEQTEHDPNSQSNDSKIKSEDNATDVDDSTDDSEAEDSTETNEKNISIEQPKKRACGRPRKFSSSSSLITTQSIGKKRMKSPREKTSLSTKNRIRKKKIIYSPNYNSRPSDNNSIDSLSTNTSLETSSKRGRKPKLFHSPVVNHQILSSSKSSEKIKQTQRLSPKKWTQKSISTVKRNKNELRCLTSTSSSLNKKAKLPPSSPSNSNNYSPKYSKKLREIERERQLIKARRKLLMNEVTTPKHVPPVVATKSIPPNSILSSTLSKPSPSILNKVLKANCNKSMESNTLVSLLSQNSIPKIINNCGQYYNNNAESYQSTHEYVTISNDYLIKSEKTDNNNKNDLIQNSTDFATNSQKVSNPPSSFLKPLNSEGETDEDRITDNDCGNEQNTSQIDETSKNEEVHNNNDQNNVIKQNNSTVMDDDDDEEPYLYDDEQLEDHINYYLEYEKAKKDEQQRLNLSHHHHQQQILSDQYHQYYPINHLQPRMMMPNNLMVDRSKFAENFPHKTNGFVNESPFSEPPKKYIDYSPAQIYVPTKKNQNLVNSYLFHVETNNQKIPHYRGDYLAQYILQKDEFEPEDIQISPRKRGRPSKNVEPSSFEHSQKARCLLEKSYLQDSACNRACLTNSVKAFKKFREFLEAQSKNEISKLKRELEESKQQVYRLTNKTTELEMIVKNERDLNKRYNPAVIKQMEERYKREISQVKRKQWCALCEAEANYFCCFKTNYCSPECQLKHWKAGHQSECTRNKNNGKINNDKAIKIE